MRSDEFWTWFDQEARPKLAGRAKTFEMMFKHLDKFDPAVIVETGCIEEPDNWHGNGCSTIMFDRYVATHPGAEATSIEIIRDKVANAKKLCPQVNFICCDSVAALGALASELKCREAVISLLYLDASHLYWMHPSPSAGHHLNELLVAMPALSEESLVAVDDAPVVADEFPMAYIGGKGQYVADYANQVGADLLFCEYQSGWTGMTRQAPANEDDLRGLLEKGAALVESNNVAAAAPIYRQIFTFTRNFEMTPLMRIAGSEACSFFAKISLRSNRLGSAADWFRKGIEVDPHAADLRCDLVQFVYLPMGHLKGAMIEAERATKVTPDYTRTWKVLGGIAVEMADHEKAVMAYDRALDIDPSSDDAMLDRAALALEMADYDTIRFLCEQVIERGGKRAADAVHCLAMVAYREHRHEEAIELYRTAIEMGCMDPGTAHWNMSLALHSIGRYREGWVEHEHREHNLANSALYIPMKRFKLPRYAGQECHESKVHPGKPALIHVHSEAGAGDNFATVRYIRVLRDRGFRVRFEANDDMVNLMRTSFPDIEVMPRAVDYPGAVGIDLFDYHVPIGSLPAVFGTEVDTIPWLGSYLKPDPILVDRWRAKLKDYIGSRLKIGLVWSSGIRLSGIWLKEYGLRKSMHFDNTKPIIQAAIGIGASIISLQVGPERSQNKEIPDLLPAKPDWAETSALIENLDLVITVDTGLAHLAGAMGKPVWLMCQKDACSWHFMCWRPGAAWNEASPWYPSMRVFRQHEFDRPHFWDDVVEDIVWELGKWQQQKAAE